MILRKDLFNINSYRKFSSIMNSRNAVAQQDRIVTKTGRVYIHGNKLRKTMFVPGVEFNIYPNSENTSLAIVYAKKGEGKYKVAKRTTKKKIKLSNVFLTGDRARLNHGEIQRQNFVFKGMYKIKVTPTLDLKSESIKNMFKDTEIALNIYSDCIIVRKMAQEKECESADCNSLVVKRVVNKVINMVSHKKKKQYADINLDTVRRNVYMHIAAGGEIQSMQVSLQNNFSVSDYVENSISFNNNYPLNRVSKEILIKNMDITLSSFFCGMGGLDYAFKTLGYKGVFALDKGFYKDTKENREKYGKENCSVLEKYHIETYRKNIGDHVVEADFLNYPIDEIPDSTVMMFGIPCVELSSVSPSRNKFVMLPKFIDRFIEIMKAKRNTCKVFVIENSINLITAGKQFLDKIRRELPWFNITENGVDAADFGAAQHRERAIIIGSTVGEIKLEKPIVKPVNTVRMCFEGLHDGIPNQLDYSKPKEDTQLRMSYVKQGGNWQDVPEELRKKGKFANYMKRLHMDELSPALANIRKSLITHPLLNRILSIRECLRIFGLPDSFICYGSLAAMQQMVCNSVPYQLSIAIAKVVKEKLELAFEKDLVFATV